MPRLPIPSPTSARACDLRLPEAALAYRRAHGLTQPAFLGAFNVTAWLYRESGGATGVFVNPNVTIRELVKQFGRAKTADAEVGFHSEMLAAQWFLERPELQVLQIFSERIPCPGMCAPMLRRYFAGVPWYYYYDVRSWRTARGGVDMRAGAALASAYRL